MPPALAAPPATRLFPADDKRIQYTGRVDFSNPRRPRFWASGAYVTARFSGPSCELLINDEASGPNHNYLHVVVDGRASRLRLTGKTNTLRVAKGLSAGPHTLLLVKDTEAGIGYLEIVGLKCAGLLPPPPRPARKIEFIGNSITCGMGADAAAVPCKTGQWFDQHNAYDAYGPTVARALSAQYHLTSVSGIGLIHSCCEMKITMPEVFDKLNQRDNLGTWDFARYQPDVVTVCLGQNDGVQDSTQFCGAYLEFLQTIRARYPRATIVCLTSPMADAQLSAALRNYLTGTVAAARAAGDQKVFKFFFPERYVGGCDSHPTLAEHAKLAQQLTAYLKTVVPW